TQLVCERFGLNGLLLGAVQEYTLFRHHFEDGGVPTDLSESPTLDQLQQYRAALAFALKPIDAGSPQISIEQVRDSALPIRVVVTLSHADKAFSAARSPYSNKAAVSEGAALEIHADGHVTL
ncbi:hypothetical protein SB847_20595, partial [Bacillus sp. SIMBA_026]|uniref:hypothetical protein n=1 Tax=Bacillus sp. SIMBA_026 TaxID=3085769 RepID=UPI00397C5A90